MELLAITLFQNTMQKVHANTHFSRTKGDIFYLITTNNN